MVGVSREPEEEKPFERSMESDSKGKKKEKEKENLGILSSSEEILTLFFFL